MSNANYQNYEYMSVSVRNAEANETANRYAALGWRLDMQESGVFKTTLTFKRDRDIKNREQLNRLQTRIEDGANGITLLKRSKKRGAKIFSCIYGSIATLIFGGGLSLVMMNPNPPDASVGLFIGGLILGVAGAAFAALTYPIYSRLVKRSVKKLNPVIENKTNDLFDLCSEANGYVNS